MVASKICSKNPFGVKTKLPVIRNGIQNRDYAKAFRVISNGTNSLVPLGIYLVSPSYKSLPQYETESGDFVHYTDFQLDSANRPKEKYAARDISVKVGGAKGTYVDVKATDDVYLICQQDCSSKEKVGFVYLKLFVNDFSRCL